MPQPRTPQIGMSKVKPLLQARALELARTLAPGGQVTGKAYCAPNPKRGERRAGSFVIWIKGPAAGAYKEYDSGETGDVFDLLIYLGQARTKKEALAWAKQFCGLDDASPARLKQVEVEARERSAELEAAQAAEDERRMAYARSLWLKSSAVERGDEVWTYLSIHREIPLERLWAVRPIGALRKAAGLIYYWGDAQNLKDGWDQRRPGQGQSRHPAMLAAMSPVGPGKSRAVHRTYLAPRGEGKARVPMVKKMTGLATGCAIKLWRGETGLSARDAVKRGAQGPLVVTEGIEDALSVAAMAPDYRVWAVGSLAGLGQMPFPKCASELIIAADNDWDKPQAQRALNDACVRLAERGTVKIARANVGKDFNDQLRAKGA